MSLPWCGRCKTRADLCTCTDLSQSAEDNIHFDKGPDRPAHSYKATALVTGHAWRLHRTVEECEPVIKAALGWIPGSWATERALVVALEKFKAWTEADNFEDECLLDSTTLDALK